MPYRNRDTYRPFFSVWLLTLQFFGVLFFISSCQNNSNPPDEASFQAVVDSASSLYDHGNQKKAVSYLNSEYKKFGHHDLKQTFEYYNLNYNYTYHFLGDSVKAILYADSMLNLFDTADKKLKYPSEYGRAHFFKGDVLFDSKHYNQAYQYFYQGKIIASNSLDVCVLSDYSYRMGMINYKQGHYRQAAANFKNGYNEHSTCRITFRTFYRRQELLNNAGISYSKLNENDSAMYFFKRALNLIDQQKERFKTSANLLDVARGVIYGNQANIYLRQHNYAQAGQLLKKSININLHTGNDNRDAQLSEMKLAHMYYDRNNQDSLFALLQNVKRQTDTIKNPEILPDWNYLAARYYIKKNDAKSALGYFKAYDSLKDVMAARQKALQEADVSEQIKRLEKNYEFDKLQKNSQLQNTMLIVILVFAVLLTIIMFLVYSNWQRSKKNIIKLDSLNNQINEQNSSLTRALAELNISSQEKDRILRTVAHDLRNPIGGISSLTGLIAEEAQTTDQQESIRLIKETSDNSLQLINEILEATNHQKTEIIKEPVDINLLITNSIELLRFKAAEKNQSIVTALLPESVQINANREQIWRVISNLISNAIKFSPLRAKIIVKAVLVADEVHICVKDNGIGVPDYLKEKIFNMFTEAKRPGTAGEKSFGLGLSICRQIIESHGGKLWFENNPEGGSTFCFSLKTTV
ncbi:MAG TPA: ATP-binding protein [Mucilaginibacter sp.]